MQKLAMEPTESTPASAIELIKYETGKWRPVIEAVGLKFE
jgi:hypothetical protein